LDFVTATLAFKIKLINNKKPAINLLGTYVGRVNTRYAIMQGHQISDVLSLFIFRKMICQAFCIKI
jgi:hypothetical protein